MKMKSVLIIMTTAAIGICIGLVVPLVLSPREEATLVNREALKVTLQEQFKDDLLTRVKEEVTVLEKEIAAGTATDKEVTAAKAKLAALKDKKVPTPPAPAPAVPGDPAPAADNQPTGKQVKDTWVQNKIDANRDMVSDADLNVGAEIYNSLDTGYLFGLADGGLTPEENVKVQEYLRANLAEGQYEIAKRLYFDYAGLMNEE